MLLEVFGLEAGAAFEIAEAASPGLGHLPGPMDLKAIKESQRTFFVIQ